MLPQGSEVFNTTYFDSLLEKVNSVGSCDQLQTVSIDVLGSLNALKAGITSQLEALTPILALLSPPGPEDAVSWITNFIEVYLRPLTLPTVNYSLQLTELTAKIAEITSAITSKQVEFPSCNVTLPQVT